MRVGSCLISVLKITFSILFCVLNNNLKSRSGSNFPTEFYSNGEVFYKILMISSVTIRHIKNCMKSLKFSVEPAMFEPVVENFKPYKKVP